MPNAMRDGQVFFMQMEKKYKKRKLDEYFPKEFKGTKIEYRQEGKSEFLSRIQRLFS